jgi:phage shock protein A
MKKLYLLKNMRKKVKELEDKIKRLKTKIEELELTQRVRTLRVMR